MPYFPHWYIGLQLCVFKKPSCGVGVPRKYFKAERLHLPANSQIPQPSPEGWIIWNFHPADYYVYHLLSQRYFVRLILPWRWRQYVPPKRRWTFNGLHDGISQKIVLLNIELLQAKQLFRTDILSGTTMFHFLCTKVGKNGENSHPSLTIKVFPMCVPFCFYCSYSTEIWKCTANLKEHTATIL
jgi:hypothetical protein